MQFFNRKLNRIKRKKLTSIQSQPVSPTSTKNQIISNFFSKIKNSLNLLQSGYQKRQRAPDQIELLKTLTRFKVPKRVKQLAMPKTIIRSSTTSAKQSRIQLQPDTKLRDKQRKNRNLVQQIKQKNKTISFTNTQYGFVKKIAKMTNDQTQNKKQQNYINSSKLGVLSSIKILQEKQHKEHQQFLLKEFFYSIIPQIEQEKSNQIQKNYPSIQKKQKRRKRSIFLPHTDNFDKKTSEKCRKLYETIVSQNQFQNQDAYDAYHHILMQKKIYPSQRRKSVAINIDYEWKK